MAKRVNGAKIPRPSGFRGWAGMLRRALGGADSSQAREALRQMGGRITLRLHTERVERRALHPVLAAEWFRAAAIPSSGSGGGSL